MDVPMVSSAIQVEHSSDCQCNFEQLIVRSGGAENLSQMQWWQMGGHSRTGKARESDNECEQTIFLCELCV